MNQVSFPFSEQYQWEGRQVIGEGGFAIIYKVKSRVNHQFYAIKQIDMDKFNAEYKLQALRNQITLMKECKGKNLVQMINFYISRQKTYIILELCQVDLKEIMNQRISLTEKEAIDILIDIVNGYKLLMSKNYIHRDIKPENVLLKNNVYKLTDYGFSKKVNYQFEKFRQVCGTAVYMAPQLFYGKQYTAKCDIWSLGLVFYEMLFGFSPWTNRCLQTYKSDIVIREVSFPYNCGIGINTKNFIQRCLQLEEQDRISFKQLFQHPLILERNPGPPFVHRQFSQKILRILGRVQRSSSRKLINVRKIFQKYENYKGVNEKDFYHFLVQLDPQITTYESQQIFHSVDFSNDGIIDMHQFRNFYIEVDYRPSSDIAAKRIEDLAKMAQARNLTIKQLFDMIDLNKNYVIDLKQFEKFIHHVAPKLSLRQIEQMFNKFDRNKTKSIDMEEFIRQITRDNEGKQRLQFPNFERALRNVQCLKMHFHYTNKSPQQILKYDQIRDSKCKGMTLDQFGKMVRQINYVISRDQIVEMFRIIDHDNSESISLKELYKLMQKQPY